MSHSNVKKSNIQKNTNTKFDKKAGTNADNRRFLERAIYILAFILIPIAVFYLQEFMLRNPFEKMKVSLQILNIIFWFLLLLVLTAMTGRLRIAAWIESIVAMLIGIADYFVISFRSNPIQPWDIKSIGVALSVANDYEWAIKSRVVICVLGFIAICCAVIPLRKDLTQVIKGRSKWPRIVMIILSLSMLLGFCRYLQSDDVIKRFKVYDKLFTPLSMTYKDGIPFSFIMELKYVSVSKPKGYSDAKAEALLNRYNGENILTEEEIESSLAQDTSSENKLSDQTRPNIIVIMNEAFSDLAVLEQDFETNMPYMPYLDSLMKEGENVISGTLDVSVLGGNTADTEYEFLTGDTMAFLPQGSIPYQQYISENTDSMASVLKAQGYSTLAMHPYRPGGWNRDTVYPLLGFDSFISEESYSGRKIRDYYSDEADYEMLLAQLDQKNDGEPLFIFNVTMQNHGAYNDLFDNFEPAVKVSGVEKTATGQYLSLIRETDHATGELLETLKGYDEPVVVVFFGDHQPADSVVSPLYRLNGNSVNNLSVAAMCDRYKVPFFIWANYDIEEERDVVISPGFLGVKTLDVAGVKLSQYQAFLRDLNEELYSVNIFQTTTADNGCRELKVEDKSLLEYRYLQYYHLFGK